MCRASNKKIKNVNDMTEREIIEHLIERVENINKNIEEK